jgi:hypothetical protein
MNSKNSPAPDISYEQAIRSGDTPVQAAEQANAVLFRGLHFSRHDTLVNILWNEFLNMIGQKIIPGKCACGFQSPQAKP